MTIAMLNWFIGGMVAIAQSGPPDPDVRPHFDRLLDRVLDGLIGTGSAADAG